VLMADDHQATGTARTVGHSKISSHPESGRHRPACLLDRGPLRLPGGSRRARPAASASMGTVNPPRRRRGRPTTGAQRAASPSAPLPSRPGPAV